MSTRRDLHGVAELKAALAALGTEVATRVGVAANRRAAKRMVDRLVAVAPVSERQSPASKRYGRLNLNIRIRRVKGHTKGRIKHQVTSGRAFWGAFYELGTARQRPRPWWRPAVEQLSDELLALQIDELRSGIDRAAKRLAKRRPLRR